MVSVVQPIERNVSFILRLRREIVRTRVDEYLVRERRGRIVEQKADSFTVRLGSRAALRTWGVFAGRKRLPILATISFHGDGADTRLELDLRSDEGYYLTRIRRVSDLYVKSFNELEDRLRKLP